MKSAIATFSRVVGKPSHSIPTDPAKLGALMADATPAAAGVKARRWTQAKSLLLRALRLCEVEVMPGRDVGGMSASWVRLASSLPSDAARRGLSRMMSSLTRKGVEPDAVTLAHIEAYSQEVLTASLLPHPERAFRSAARLWNQAAANTPGWPALFIEVGVDKRRYALEWGSFQETFQSDVSAYLARGSDPDPFAHGDPARGLSPATIKGQTALLLRTASALVASGFPIEKLDSLKTLVEPANARAALIYVRDRMGKPRSPELANIARLLATISKNYVGASAEVEKAYKDMVKAVVPPQIGMTEKNRTRLHQFDVPENLNAILDLPARVLRETKGQKAPDRHAAVRLEYAVAIELLTMAPMRIKNLTGIEIGRHLQEVRRGPHRRWRLVIPAHETKNKKPYEAPLTEESARLLDYYLQHHHPKLTTEPSKMLFPGLRGARRSESSFGSSISTFIRRETGIKMHPHLFRHLAGLIYLSEHPDGIEVVRQFLGHSSAETTLRFYAELRAEQAVRRLDDVIAKRRDAHRKPFSKKSRSEDR
jgi:integrase